MIENLIVINNRLIKEYENNEEKQKRHLLIKKILETKNSFYKMKIEMAYSILRDLKIKEENIKSVYMNLIDAKNI